MNKHERDRNKYFNSSPSWDIPSDRKVRWTLETEKTDINRKLRWYANVLQEPKLTMSQFLQLARERNHLSVRLDEVKKLLVETKRNSYERRQLVGSVVDTVKVPQGIRLGR